MNRARRTLLGTLVLALAIMACTMPAAVQAPRLSDQEIADTAVAKALAAIAPSATPVGVPTATDTPTATATNVPVAQCSPTVTAITDANVRAGPGTGYSIVGALPTGGVAAVAGRNDSNTWWFIQFAGGSGGYAWIAGSVVTPACIPSVVQVVAAPPLPTAPAQATDSGGLFVFPGLLGPLHILPSATPTFDWSSFQIPDFNLPDLPFP